MKILKKKYLPLLLRWAVLAAIIAFIWGNSLANQAESAAQSSYVREIIERIFHTIGIQPSFTTHLLRKLAHFTEFLWLGMILVWVLPYRMPFAPKIHRPLWAGSIAFCVAFVDETLQLFSDRSGEIRDVWIDFSGAVSGILLMCLILHLFRRLRKKHRRHRATSPTSGAESGT